MKGVKTIIENYKLICNLPEKTADLVSSVCKVSKPKASMILKEKEIIDRLVKTKKIDEEKIEEYKFAAKILFPGEFSVDEVLSDEEIFALEKLKFNKAARFLDNCKIPKKDIAAKLKCSVKKIEDELQNAIVIKGDDTADHLRTVSRVREFYEVYHNATIKEGAKALQMTNQELSDIVDELRLHNESVAVKRVPTEIERARLSKKIIELKSQDVSLSNKDIATKLNVPVSEVSKAIKKTLKDWQYERAENYDFYFKNTLTELQVIQAEALGRFKGSDKSSSRWLEIYLMASEKKIKMLGLNAPEKLDVQSNVFHATKEERDAVVAAYQATEIIDADFDKVEVTQEKKEEFS